MKTILFLGRKEDKEEFSKRIQGHQELQLRSPKNARKLDKYLKAINPDFVIFAGEIQLNQDGKYFILI
ncbi:MAG: hypothetical protein D6814_02525 [Calditrichaeota bacterium]|nr:MAG: hypothetical protein D6814_02525 [Calditrichota bacterium]